jgi:beta-phosphoglucomutase-like phosphatase (HAD superfamily)
LRDFAAIIFDFDGVIADSEMLADLVLAEELSRLGLPTTLEQCYARYVGTRWDEMIARIEEGLGGPVPEAWGDQLSATMMARFRSDLREVPGAGAFIAALGDRPRGIASSSSPARLALCLDVLGLARLSAPTCSAPKWSRAASPRPTSSCSPRKDWRRRPKPAS